MTPNEAYNAIINLVEGLGYDPDWVTKVEIENPWITVTTKSIGGGLSTSQHYFKRPTTTEGDERA